MTDTKDRLPRQDGYSTMMARATFYRNTAKRKQAQATEYRLKADALEREAQDLQRREKPQP